VGHERQAPLVMRRWRPHEQLAADAHGDPEEHLRRAAEHRSAAGGDREIAKERRAEALRSGSSVHTPRWRHERGSWIVLDMGEDTEQPPQDRPYLP
jgi:hypothetical protein